MTCRHVRAVVVLAVVAVASACINSTTVIKLNADASGTVEQTMAMSKETVKQLEEFGAALSQGKKDEGAAEGKADFDLFSEDKAREEAAKFGSGVTFVSAEKFDRDGFVGLTAVYAFKDIGSLRVNEKPDSPGGMMGAPGGDSADDDIRFTFERLGATSALTVRLADDRVDDRVSGTEEPEAEADEPDTPPGPGQLAMVKRLFKGLRIEIAVEVAGDIVKTNADYVAGRRVTLLAMDFEKILDNEDLLMKMQKPESLAAAKAALQGLEGFKINTAEDIRIEFSGR